LPRFGLGQESPDSGNESGPASERSLTLPHDENAPAQATQRALHAAIARGVAVDLGDPVCAVGGGNAAPAAGVAMPEAAAYEEGFLEAGEYEIGRAGQGGIVEARTVPQGLNDAPDDQLGGRVARFDRERSVGTP
jgi:hypothetical protein